MHSRRHDVQEPDADDPADTPPARRDPFGFERARLLWDMDRQAAATFPGAPRSVATARRFVRITGAVWRLRRTLLEDVELCMSELVGNAVTHTGTARVHCRLWSARGVLFLEVDDEDAGPLPRVGCPGEDDECGRGMLLIQSFALAWGVARCAGGATPGEPGRARGKTVWAALLLGRGSAGPPGDGPGAGPRPARLGGGRDDGRGGDAPQPYGSGAGPDAVGGPDGGRDGGWGGRRGGGFGGGVGCGLGGSGGRRGGAPPELYGNAPGSSTERGGLPPGAPEPYGTGPEPRGTAPRPEPQAGP